MMKKIYELLAKKQLKGDVGIEIECEGKHLKEMNTEVWHSEDDGSLRGVYPDSRAEYVLNKPIPLETVTSAMEELNHYLKNSKIDFSFRTSVHVHVNVLDLTVDQLCSFIYTYLLLEEALFSYCGNIRKANRFCLRIQDAEGILGWLNPVFKEGWEAIKKLREDAIRYAAINLASINKYGSVEFRGMRGTIDTNVINTWASALISIRNYACHHENVLSVHDEYVKLGSSAFLEHVLGKLSSNFMYKNYERDIQRNYSLTIDLPYSFQELLNKMKIKEEEPKKELKIEPVPLDWNDINRLQAEFRQDNPFVVPPRVAPRRRAAPRMILDDIRAALVQMNEEDL